MPERPEPVPVSPDDIPEILRATPRWVVWRYVFDPDGQDWDKPPVNARTGGMASSTNPATWSDYRTALEAYRVKQHDGLGLVLHRKPADEGHGLVGIDLDHCRDPKSGDVADWAREIVRELDSYTEVSPSGEGLRIFLLGRLPPGRRKKGDVEMYDTARYVTVTGCRLQGSPRSVGERQAELEHVHARVFGETARAAPRPTPPLDLADEELIAVASASERDGAKFRALWSGDCAGYHSRSEAHLALCNRLAFYCGPDPERIEQLFLQSGMGGHDKAQRPDYRMRTIQRALEGRSDFYKGGRRGANGTGHAGNGHHPENGTNGHHQEPPGPEAEPAAWEKPIPLGADCDTPPFPLDCLPLPLRGWVEAESEARQVPPDLPALLALAVCGAGAACKFRVLIREGWSEPTNLFVVIALLSGERKSPAFRDAVAPVKEYEAEEAALAAPLIAAAQSERRSLESRVKHLEAKAGKEDDKDERRRLVHEAKQAARDLAEFVVPAEPQAVCDDETPENLQRLLALHKGRMLQASPEGTAFEIAKGRYSERANFDVYLKAHSGDPLRVGRIGRPGDRVEQPALSVALAVQPDVIHGLAEQASMRGRGLLARFLYSIPHSWVGRRKTRSKAVPAATALAYRDAVLRLWRLQGATDAEGKPAPHLLHFSREADAALERFERWLEPQLADGEELSYLHGWGNKLAGAVARIAGIFHLVEAVSAGRDWATPVTGLTVTAAVSLAQSYLLPHAQTAFGLMGADPKVQDARRVIRWIKEQVRGNSLNSLNSLKGFGLWKIGRSDLHSRIWGGTRTVEQVQPILDLLVKHAYLRPVEEEDRRGPGRRPSPAYEINPQILSENSENSENSPTTNQVFSNSGASVAAGDAWEG